jgi:hypothetical protein
LKFIGADILKSLKNLERVNFEGNTCIDISYDKDKDPPAKLQQLIHEISEKCQPPVAPLPRNTNGYEIRLQTLENEVRELKAENQYLSAKVALIAPLEVQITHLQTRLNQLGV